MCSPRVTRRVSDQWQVGGDPVTNPRTDLDGRAGVVLLVLYTGTIGAILT